MIHKNMRRMIFIKKLKVLEIFSGTQSISKAFREAGHETFTVDFDEVFQEPEYENTDLFIDVLDLTAEMVLEKFGRPDIIWASPDCKSYSVAGISHHRRKEENGNLRPISEYAVFCDKVNRHMIKLIKELDPKCFFIENPRGGMRKMDFVQDLPRYTITYCQYGDFRMKPTDIWSNHPNPKFKTMCKNGDPCHARSPRGSVTGTQGIKGSIERSRIPEEFCKHIVKISEE